MQRISTGDRSEDPRREPEAEEPPSKIPPCELAIGCVGCRNHGGLCADKDENILIREQAKQEIRDQALAEAYAIALNPAVLLLLPEHVKDAAVIGAEIRKQVAAKIERLRSQPPTAWVHPDAHAQESKRAAINDARMGQVADLANRYGWADSEYDDAIEFVESLLFKGRDKLAEAERKADEAAKQLAEAVAEERERLSRGEQNG